MKSAVDTSTDGGRIRYCRQKLNLSLEQMSQKVNVSGNYISMIERGVKNPSDKVLARIAEVAGVSFDWLKNGDRQDSAPAPEKPTSPQFSVNAGDLDASLFLSLVLSEASGISKEAMATVLAVDAETLDNILAGTIKFDPAWEFGFPNLAQRLEIPDVLKKLHKIESFLEGIETKKADAALIPVFKDALSREVQDEFAYVNQSYHSAKSYVDIRQPNENPYSPVRDFVFQQKKTGDMWHVKLYSAANSGVMAELLFRAIDPRDHTIGNTVLVFSDEEAFNLLLSEKDSVLQRVIPCCQNKLPTVLLMLVDLDSMPAIEAKSIINAADECESPQNEQ